MLHVEPLAAADEIQEVLLARVAQRGLAIVAVQQQHVVGLQSVGRFQRLEVLAHLHVESAAVLEDLADCRRGLLPVMHVHVVAGDDQDLDFRRKRGAVETRHFCAGGGIPEAERQAGEGHNR